MQTQAIRVLQKCDPWARAFLLQQATVEHFHSVCGTVLSGSCELQALDQDQLSLKRNLFSTLFLMAVEAAGVAPEKLPFYAMVTQCLRVQVTGCDNILDDEYKSAIPFALAGGGIRFRSVLTIMTGDAVLADLVAGEVAAGRLSRERARRLLNAVLAVLIPSGLEEHEEESQQAIEVPTVRRMLDEVHYRKTGQLFEAPVRLVEKMEDADPARSGTIAEALATFGVGCQILDDLKDVADDLFFHKHNLVLSAAWYGQSAAEQALVRALPAAGLTLAAAEEVAERLPEARKSCLGWAIQYFQRAQQAFSSCLPAFGHAQAAALGLLVQGSIMAERNELILRSLL
jgi:hypothetical protein